MAFVVETGAGTPNANAYATPAFVTTYLTERNRETENSWSTETSTRQQEAIVVATQYVDRRFGRRFKGGRLRFLIPGRAASGTIAFAALPDALETVTVGQVVYRFVDALAQEDDVLRGATAAEAATNLAEAVNSGGESSAVHEDTLENFEATASVNGATVTVEAQAKGTSGNDVAFATTTGGTITPGGFLVGGLDEGPQPLEFPRTAIYDRDGQAVQGVPLKLKQAVAEYAVRSLASQLDPDPTVDDSGALVQRKREKVGPIEEETEYVAGAQPRIDRPYPAADGLLADYLVSGAGVIR